MLVGAMPRTYHYYPDGKSPGQGVAQTLSHMELRKSPRQGQDLFLTRIRRETSFRRVRGRRKTCQDAVRCVFST